MLKTIRHKDADKLVVAAKLLTGFVSVSEKITDPDSFIKLHQTFDADFVSHTITWQKNHGLTADGAFAPYSVENLVAAHEGVVALFRPFHAHFGRRTATVAADL